MNENVEKCRKMKERKQQVLICLPASVVEKYKTESEKLGLSLGSYIRMKLLSKEGI